MNSIVFLGNKRGIYYTNFMSLNVSFHSVTLMILDYVSGALLVTGGGR